MPLLDDEFGMLQHSEGKNLSGAQGGKAGADNRVAQPVELSDEVGLGFKYIRSTLMSAGLLGDPDSPVGDAMREG